MLPYCRNPGMARHPEISAPTAASARAEVSPKAVSLALGELMQESHFKVTVTRPCEKIGFWGKL